MEQTTQHLNTKNTQVAKFLQAQGFDPKSVRHAIIALTGISQTEAARRAGIARIVVTNAINYERRNPEKLARVAEVYEVPVPIFFPEASFCLCDACKGHVAA